MKDDEIVPGNYEKSLKTRTDQWEFSEGKYSVEWLANETCPECKTSDEVFYTGTECLDGSLEIYFLVHTEIEDYFHCKACGYAWIVHKYL